MMNSHRTIGMRAKIAALLTIGVVVLAVISCAATPSRTAIPPFRQGVVTADQQTSAAFADINSFLRRQQVEHALDQNALTENLFSEALASEDLAKWNRAFALIDSYAEKIERLLAPEQRSGVEGELSELGERIGALRKDQLPAGMSAAFTNLGGLLVQQKAERDALKAIRKADPAIQDVFSSMMVAIGSDSESGVRGTVKSSWRQILARIDVREFRRAPNMNAKRAAVLRYVEALDERDAQDRILNTLRLSFSTLARSHQQIAQGQNGSAVALIKLIQDEYTAFRQQLDSIREKRSKDSTNGGSV